MKIFCKFLELLMYGLAGLLIILFAIGVLSCNTVKKAYSKQIVSVDSITHSSTDSASVKTDKGTVSELKEGEYERVTVEYEPRNSLADTTQDTPNIDKHHIGGGTEKVSRIIYERGKTKEQRVEVKDTKDSAVHNSQTAIDYHKFDKEITKYKDVKRFPWLGVILIGGGLILIGYLYFKHFR